MRVNLFCDEIGFGNHLEIWIFLDLLMDGLDLDFDFDLDDDHWLIGFG